MIYNLYVCIYYLKLVERQCVILFKYINIVKVSYVFKMFYRVQKNSDNKQC